MGTLDIIGEWPEQRVLVSGVDCPLGHAFCPQLWGKWHVTAITDSAQTAGKVERLGGNPVVVDILDAEALRKAVIDARPAIVVHLAAGLEPGHEPGQTEKDPIRQAGQREMSTHNLMAAVVAAGAKRQVCATGLQCRAGEAEIEQRILQAPPRAVILRLGAFYGPGTGFDAPPVTGSVHVEAAADAIRRALTAGQGSYHIADDDGTGSSQRAKMELDWRSSFRSNAAKAASRLADSIWRSKRGGYAVPDLAQMKAFLDRSIEQENTKIVFDQLFDYCWAMTWGGNEEKGIRETLDVLEDLMPVSSLASCILMARLFARASRLKIEYVCNSCIVWILKTKSPGLKVQLELLAGDTPDQNLKDTYLSWARAMAC